MKITIANEEVLCSNDFTINQEMLNTPSVILNNVYPASWELDKDYTSRFYHPDDYSQCKIFNEIPAEPGTEVTDNPISANVDNTKSFEYKLFGGTTQKTTTGKNLIFTSSDNWEVGSINPSTGAKQSNTARLRTDYCPITPGTYYASLQSNSYCWINMEFYKSDKTFISAHGGISGLQNTTITVPTNTAYYKAVIKRTDNGDMSTSEIATAKPQVETGSSPTSWEEYTGGNASPSIDYPQEVKTLTGNITLVVNNTSYPINFESIELCKIEDYQDKIYKENDKWYLYKEIGKVILNGSASDGAWYANGNNCQLTLYSNKGFISNSQTYSNNFKSVVYSSSNLGLSIYQSGNTSYLRINKGITQFGNISTFKTWLSNNNITVYYVLGEPTTQEITDSNLINELNAIELENGLNTISLTHESNPQIYLHYNFTQASEDILFCGVVKNSGNISLNPRYPHYSTLQILDYKTFLSEGETLDFVIANKTILEAIQQVISVISGYGFQLGNVSIFGSNDVIGAYSTKDKTAYDVFNYIADITQSRWTTRVLGVGKVAIDFYDPTLMPQGTAIDYNQTWFCNNKIIDMTYNYGTWDYRNKQVMTSNGIIGSVTQTQTITTDGYSQQYATEQMIGQINSITLNGVELSVATNYQKSLGMGADVYYTPGSNILSTSNTFSVGGTLVITYVPVVEGRQIVQNIDEIERVNEATGVKGVVSRYENRNDATTSMELQKIGQSYIKYKGTPEIRLTIKSQNNLWKVGDRVDFNAPITELDTEYMVKSKKINYIVTANTIFYTFELTSSFNSESEINYFDNQRAKAKGNIGEDETITRNVDIETTANIIFFDNQVEEVSITGDNILNCTLNSPLVD